MDLFDMLNPMWSSILPYCHWLWSYNQNRLRFWCFFNLLTQGLQPRVGRCSMAAFKLILRGESNTGIYFPLRWLVIEESLVMSPILPIMPLFEPLTKSPQLPLDHLSGA